MRALLLQPVRPSRVDRAQSAPLERHASALRAAFGFELEQTAVAGEGAFAAVRRARPDLVLAQARVFFDRSRQRTIELLDEMRTEGPRVAWLDSRASAGQDEFWVSPAVDLTLRRAWLRRRKLYGRPWLHGRPHADATRRRLAPTSRRRLGRGLGLLAGGRPHARLWQLLRLWRAALVPGELVWKGCAWPRGARVALAWNVALEDGFAALAAAPPPASAGRDVDVNCRVRADFLHAPAWYVVDRLDAVCAASRLAGRWRVVATAARLDRAGYLAELRRSRLAISPFGWGEICFRDFETILAGALLVKPSMRHLETWPDVYRPHETYVPVRWDWSDLEPACRPYLENEAWRRELAENARRTLVDALGEEAFVARIGAVLGHLAADGD